MIGTPPAFCHIFGKYSCVSVASQTVEDVSAENMIAGPGWLKLFRLARKSKCRLQVSLPYIEGGQLNVSRRELRVQFQHFQHGIVKCGLIVSRLRNRRR